MHPAPPSSIHLQPAHFNLRSALCLGKKIKSCPFWLKIGTHGILEVLIPNAHLDFWNSDPKIHFWANLGQKSQSCPFFLKTGTHSILVMLIFIPTLVFWIADPKSIFGLIWAKKVKVVQFDWKLAQSVSIMLLLIPALFFSVSNPKFFFGQIWTEKFKVVHFDWKLAHMVYQGCWFLFQQ